MEKEKPKFISKVKLYVDGASRRNPGPAGIGGVILDADNERLLDQFCKFKGEKTNNEAEYLAIIEGLSVARKHTRKLVWVFSDSEFVIRQIKKRYTIKEERMEPLCLKVLEKERLFEEVHFDHRSSGDKWIKRADILAKQAIDRALF
jgi:ribonuclease HI